MMKKKFIPGRTPTVRLAACSALAILLAAGPPSYNPETDSFNYPAAAYAEKSCFVAGTRILMADGSEIPIEEIKLGQRVWGEDGQINRVIGIERVALGGRKLYSLNGSQPFVTAEHPFRTPQGWKSLDPLMTAEENARLQVSKLHVGDQLIRALYRQVHASQGNLAQVADPELIYETLLLEMIESTEADPELIVYNLLLDGNHTYIADGYLVHNKGGDDDGGSSGSGGGGGSDDDDGGNSGSGSGGGGDDDDDDDNSGSGGGSDDDDDDDRSGSGGGDDDDDRSGRGHGGDDDDRDHDRRGHNDDDDRGHGDRADDDEDEREGHGRGRGRGEHADRIRIDNRVGNELDPDFERTRIDQRFDADGNLVRERIEERRGVEGQPGFERSRIDRRFDADGTLARERIDEREGVEGQPDFERSRTDKRFNADGTLVRERTDERSGAEGSADFERTRSDTRLDADGNVIRERSRTQVGPDLHDDGAGHRSGGDHSNDFSPAGPDLTPDQEMDLIQSGWGSSSS